jgi:hypothetical protein
MRSALLCWPDILILVKDSCKVVRLRVELSKLRILTLWIYGFLLSKNSKDAAERKLNSRKDIAFIYDMRPSFSRSSKVLPIE